LVVRSGVLNCSVFFVPDDRTKDSLIAAGVEPGSIYTHFELAVLVKRRVSVDELRLIHEAKQRFDGTVTP